jgi:phospholipid/cholesterol/gamma-HCH transport system substrate-binding protein
MTKERNALKAGLFILASVALIVGVLVSIKGIGRLAEGRVTRTATFRLTDDVGGLRVGDDVRVGGWKVGTIQSIEAVGLDGDDPRLQVAFSLPARFKLRQGAQLGMQVTLTGTPSLNIEALGKGTEYAEADVITGRPDPKTALIASLGDASTDIAMMARDVRTTTVPKANAALDSFKSTGDSATALVSDVKGQVIPDVVKRYDGVTDKTGAMMQSITDMVGPATTDWKGLLANLNSASGSLKEKLPGMLGKVETSLDSAQKALEDIQKTVANTKDLSGSLKQVIGGNEGKLNGVIAGLKTTGDNLKAASAEIRRSPWRLLYKPAPNEVANLNVYDSARQFAEGANELNDAAGSLRDAIKTGAATPQEVQEMVNRLEKSFAKFHDVEGRLWQEVK